MMNIQQINSDRFEVFLANTLSKQRSGFHGPLRKSLKKLFPVLEEFLWEHEAIGKKFSKYQVDKVSLGLHICGRKKIRSLNNEFRAKDKETDVLSFPLYDLRKERKIEGLCVGGPLNLGDIFISLDVADRQAKVFNISLNDEIIHLFVHGFLHLVGYDHEISLKEEKVMQSLEEQIIGKLGAKS